MKGEPMTGFDIIHLQLQDERGIHQGRCDQEGEQVLSSMFEMQAQVKLLARWGTDIQRT